MWKSFNILLERRKLLLEVIRLFKEIQNTSSLNDKKAIITANKDNELFKKCLIFLLDGNVVTGISSKKLGKKIPLINFAEIDFCHSFSDVMNYLKKNNSGRDYDIYAMQLFLKTVPDEDREFYEQMITKKFRLGIDVKGVNKAIPNLIQTWDVQQAYPLDDKNMPKDGEWFALSQKLNGNNNGVLDSKCISRQGKEFTGMEHIIADINKLSFKDMFFNGELIRKNEDNLPDDENFQIGTGVINSDDTDKTCIKFVI